MSLTCNWKWTEKQAWSDPQRFTLQEREGRNSAPGEAPAQRYGKAGVSLWAGYATSTLSATWKTQVEVYSGLSISGRHQHMISWTGYCIVPRLQSVPSILTGQRRHFLMTVHPDIFYIRIYFCANLLSVVVLHQDLRVQYVQMEVPQKWADVALSCYIERPFCINPNWITFLIVRDISEFLDGWDLILQRGKKRESSRNNTDTGGSGVFLKVFSLPHGIDLA